MEWLLNVYAILSVLPFFSFALIWFLIYFIYRDKKRSTATAIDVTTLLLIGIVSAMYNTLFDTWFGGLWWIVLFFLIVFGVLGNLQNRLKGSVDVKRLMRAVWRIGFLVLSFCYVILIIVGIVQYLNQV